MQAERDHLVRFVFPRLRRELLARNIHLVDYDLRWGVTGDQNVVEACREIIDQCRPWFLCMLGQRYGHVPDGQVKSITSDEVFYGVLDDTASRENALFYFRDHSILESIDNDLVDEFREPSGSDEERKLSELKSNIIAAGFNPRMYTAVWDADSKSLTALQEFGDNVYSDLMECIERAFGAAQATHTDRYDEQTSAALRHAEALRQSYHLGRRKGVFESVLEHVETGGENNYLAVTGPPGSGKSSFIAYCARELRKRFPDRVLIEHYVGATAGSTDISKTIMQISHELIVATGAEVEVPEPTRDQYDKFKVVLQAISELRDAIVLIDGIDHLDRDNPARGLSWLPAMPPNNIRFILSSPTGLSYEDAKGRRVPTEVDLRPLSKVDRREIVRSAFRRNGKTLSGQQLEELVSKPDADKPLYLQIAIEELRTLGAYEEISERISGFPETTIALFQWVLSRLEKDDGFRDSDGKHVGHQLVPDLISALAVSRGGLSERELGGILAPFNHQHSIPNYKNSDRRGLSLIRWVKPSSAGHTSGENAERDDQGGNLSALLHLLRPYLMQRMDDAYQQEELVYFAHDEFQAAAEDLYFDNDEVIEISHGGLATFFSNELRGTPHLRGPHSLPRGRSEVVYHHVCSGMWNELLDLLRDTKVFDKVSAHALGMSYHESSYKVDKNELMPGQLSNCPVDNRVETSMELAHIFAQQAKKYIRRAQSFEQPWPGTAEQLRTTNTEEFVKFRDAFYMFAQVSKLAASWVNSIADDRWTVSKQKRKFLKSYKDVASFTHYLGHFGTGETGLSGQMEDMAYIALMEWDKLRTSTSRARWRIWPMVS
jgi:DNA polymerase III delta prime subunit